MKIVYKKALRENRAKVEEFLAEVEMIKQINHPNVLTLYEFSENPSCYQIVIEYIGES